MATAQAGESGPALVYQLDVIEQPFAVVGRDRRVAFARASRARSAG
jgi:hypothetical protein